MKRIAMVVAFLFVTSMVFSSFLTTRANAISGQEFGFLMALVAQGTPCVVASEQGLEHTCL